MSITIERVKELRAAAKHTPWWHDPDDERAPIRDCNGGPVIEAENLEDVWVDAYGEDVALMAAAPDIADLCISQAEEIEELRKQVAELRMVARFTLGALDRLDEVAAGGAP